MNAQLEQTEQELLYSDQEETGKEPRKQKKTGKKKKTGIKKYRFFIISALMIVLIALTSIGVLSFNSSYIVVSMRFSEITQGNNPDRSPFDIYELLSDEVLNSACEKIGGVMDAETLKSHITLSSNSAAGSFQSIQQKVMDGNNDYYYFPNRYTITYSVLSNRIRNDGLAACWEAVCESFTLPPKSEILNAVAQAYYAQYQKRHIIYDSIFNMNWEKYRALDHFNKISELKRLMEMFSRFEAEKYSEAPEYVSSLGVGFGDLNAEVRSILNVDLESYQSFVIQNGITTDKERLLEQLRYVSNYNQEIYAKKTAQYNVLLEGIAMYDPNITKVAFIPALDTDNEFYMNRTKIGIDYLTRDADAAKMSAEDANSIARQYTYLEKQFAKLPMPEPEEFVAADEIADRIIEKLDAFCQKAKQVNKEYVDNVSYENVEISGVVHGKDMTSLLVAVGKIVLFFTMLFYSLACLLYYGKLAMKRRKDCEGEAGDMGDHTESV